MLGTYVLAKYQYENVPPFTLDNIALQISFFATFIYFIVVIVYQILYHDANATIKKEDEKYVRILGHVRFLSGTLAAACLIQILIPYFGWLLLGMWTMFLVKIAYYWDKPFYNFHIFSNENNNNNINGEEEEQEQQSSLV